MTGAVQDRQVLSSLPADREQKRLALGVVLVSLVIFIALVPFARVPIGQFPTFIPIYQTALVINDVITAVLLFGQLRVMRTRALLVLACGYVFTALMTLLHALTFPGAFTSAGLLGSGTQSTAYLFSFWHAGFPLFVIGYAFLKDEGPIRQGPLRLPIAGSLAAVLLLVGVFGYIAIAANDLLPKMLDGNRYAPAGNFVRAIYLASALLAALVLWRRRPHSVLDLWLLVVLCAWCFDLGLSAVFNTGRYDLGFYAGRAYGLLAASFVLIVLLTEQSKVYAGLLQAQKIARSEAALRESEARFRTMADAIPQLAWMARPDGWIYWYNRRWYEYTGTTPADMEGWGWQSVHDPETLPAVVERWTGSISTGEPFEMVFPLRGADGVLRPFLTRISPFKDANGNVVHWFGTNTDITAQREAEEVLRRADRRKDEFIATLAHELRNPLAPIRNAVEILRRLSPAPEGLDGIRDIIDRQARHLTRLVDDLLEVSRITQGKIQLRKERIALARPIGDALEAIGPMLQSAGLKLTVSFAPEPLYVEADATRVSQILLNLLNNAVKFTPRGGHLWLTSERRAGEVVLSVRDTGVGIPSEHLTTIFEMFSQVSPALERAQGGLGIGLALVRGLVELHGGSIEARSPGLGKGSEFIVRLPLAPASQQSERRAAPAPASDDTPAGKRILVVDDNRDAAGSLRLLLEMLGHEVREAHDGVEGIHATQAFAPDVVLLDIGMPKMNGYDAAREIRKQAAGAKILLVAMTGWGQEEDRRRAIDAGFDLHLTKPVELAALQSLLRPEKSRAS